MTECPKLCAQDVSVTIDNQPILSEVNLCAQAGQVVGILGPNGAGKTTLLKVLSGQLPCQSKVSWDNRLLTEYDAVSLAKQIAVVNQLNDSVFALNLYQIVRMGLLPHKSLLSRHSTADEKNILQAIERVGLTKKSTQGFSSLSGGEQQRGLIARALVQKAALIVLDEPVNHLDVYYQHQVLTLLQSLARSLNITVVMTLHDMNLAANYCDHLCLLNLGKVICQGTPKEVLKSNLLTDVFRTPCAINLSDQDGTFRVDFYPPTTTNSASSLPKRNQLNE